VVAVQAALTRLDDGVGRRRRGAGPGRRPGSRCEQHHGDAKPQSRHPRPSGSTVQWRHGSLHAGGKCRSRPGRREPRAKPGRDAIASRDLIDYLAAPDRVNPKPAADAAIRTPHSP
jgi:hypothetical protein